MADETLRFPFPEDMDFDTYLDSNKAVGELPQQQLLQAVGLMDKKGQWVGTEAANISSLRMDATGHYLDASGNQRKTAAELLATTIK